MWIVKYVIPILAILGFGHAAYENLTGKVDANKMGVTMEHIKMFGLLALIQTIGWVIVIIGVRTGAAWTKSVAVFSMALFFFDYVVSLPSYKNLGDKAFKYWAGVVLLLLVGYCIWL